MNYDGTHDVNKHLFYSVMRCILQGIVSWNNKIECGVLELQCVEPYFKEFRLKSLIKDFEIVFISFAIKTKIYFHEKITTNHLQSFKANILEEQT